MGTRRGCWFWTKDEHNPRLLGTQGTPLIVGVLTGAKHCELYGFSMKPGGHSRALEVGAKTMPTDIATAAAAADKAGTAQPRFIVVSTLLSLLMISVVSAR